MCRCVGSHFCCNLHFKTSIIFLKSGLIIFFLLLVSLEELPFIIVLTNFSTYPFFQFHLLFCLLRTFVLLIASLPNTLLTSLSLIHLTTRYVNQIKSHIKIKHNPPSLQLPPFQTPNPSLPLSSSHMYTLIYCSLASTFYSP